MMMALECERGSYSRKGEIESGNPHGRWPKYKAIYFPALESCHFALNFDLS